MIWAAVGLFTVGLVVFLMGFYAAKNVAIEQEHARNKKIIALESSAPEVQLVVGQSARDDLNRSDALGMAAASNTSASSTPGNVQSTSISTGRHGILAPR